MKKISLFIIITFGLSLGICFSQEKHIDLKSIFNSRETFINNDIPDTFLFYYKPFIEIEHKKILDTLAFLLSSIRIKESSIVYIIEFVPPDYRYMLHGVIWSDDFFISYYWDNVDKHIEIMHGVFPNMAKPFMKDIESWNESILNRSYYCTSIADAWFAFVTRYKKVGNLFSIDHTVFRKYDKDHFEFYLKEKAINNFKKETIINPDYLNSK